MNEAKVTINGATISEGEDMTIRVALNCYLADLAERGPTALGDDNHGRAMVDGYTRNARLTLSRMSNDPVSHGSAANN